MKSLKARAARCSEANTVLLAPAAGVQKSPYAAPYCPPPHKHNYHSSLCIPGAAHKNTWCASICGASVKSGSTRGTDDAHANSSSVRLGEARAVASTLHPRSEPFPMEVAAEALSPRSSTAAGSDSDADSFSDEGCIPIEDCPRPKCDCADDEGCRIGPGSLEDSCEQCPVAQCFKLPQADDVAGSTRSPLPLAVMIALPVVIVCAVLAIGVALYVRRRRKRGWGRIQEPHATPYGSGADGQSDRTAAVSSVLQRRLDKLKPGPDYSPQTLGPGSSSSSQRTLVAGAKVSSGEAATGVSMMQLRTHDPGCNANVPSRSNREGSLGSTENTSAREVMSTQPTPEATQATAVERQFQESLSARARKMGIRPHQLLMLLTTSLDSQSQTDAASSSDASSRRAFSVASSDRAFSLAFESVPPLYDCFGVDSGGRCSQDSKQ